MESNRDLWILNFSCLIKESSLLSLERTSLNMIYLDYAAHTPVSDEVLQTFFDVSRDYIANPNSPYKLGREAAAKMEESTNHIAALLGVKESEIIYTSGATESNNLAIKGIASAYKRYGKHIITTYLEHSSVTGAITALQNQGYDVDFVPILEDGLVDLNQLKELIREDTILVSICYVDSEIGLKQPIEEIGEVLKDYPHCYFHVDATQAVGKVPISLNLIDLMTFTPHKFFGMNGSGILIKKENILLEPIIHGGISTTKFRSGTPVLPMAVAAEKALSTMLENLEYNYSYVTILNKQLREGLEKYSNVYINSTSNSIPYILNISFKGINSGAFQEALEKHDIYVSTKSACCAPNTASRPVYAITRDRKLAMSTLRISVSHQTTKKEIDTFLFVFDECLKELG